MRTKASYCEGRGPFWLSTSVQLDHTIQPAILYMGLILFLWSASGPAWAANDVLTVGNTQGILVRTYRCPSRLRTRPRSELFRLCCGMKRHG